MQACKMIRTAVWATLMSGCVCSAWAQQVTLTFLAADSYDNFRPVIEGFEQLHPEIRIIYQSVPFNDLNAAVEARIARGDASVDVIAVDTPRIPAYAHKQYLLNLEDRAQLIRQTFSNPVDIEHVSYQGGIYAYPMWTSTQQLFYNRALLDAAGIEPPSSDPAHRITWAQLVDKAKAAQAAGAKWGLMFTQPDRFYQLQPLFESNGGGSGLHGEYLLEPSLTSAAWIEAASWYGELFAQGIAPRGIVGSQIDDLFINGELAFMIGEPMVFGRYNKAAIDYGVALHPYFEGGRAVTPTGSWALAINPHSRHIEAARIFTEYVSLDPEGAWLACAANAHMPTHPAAFERFAEELAELSEKIGPVDQMIRFEATSSAIARPRTTGYVVFETVMNNAFSDIRNGAPAADVLKATEGQLGRRLSRLR